MTPTTLHETTVFNAEASLNDWLRSQIATFALPAWMGGTVHFITDWPEIEKSLPCISVAHLPGYRRGEYERGDVSARQMLARGLVDVSAWVSRSQLYQGQEVWLPRLRFMEGMIEQAHAGAVAIVIRDYLTSLSNPQDTPYRIILGDISVVQTGPDPNPDIERRRALINYRWFLRSE